MRRSCLARAGLLAGVFVVALLLVLASASPALALDSAGPWSTSAGTARIAVKLAPGSHFGQTADGRLRVLRDWTSLTTPAEAAGLPLRMNGQMGDLGITVLEPAAGLASNEAADATDEANALRLMPGVLWAEVGTPVHACLVPNDPYYPPNGQSVGQWGLVRLGLPAAWDITTGSSSVVVAFTDTGLNRDIADFAGRIVSPYSVTDDSSEWPAWSDEQGHGSAVAAVAVAQGNDGQGIAGAAWNVGIMPVKISDGGESDTVTLAQGIEYAVDHGAKIINISFQTAPGIGPGQSLKDAVAYAVNAGVLVVAASGNDDDSTVSYPARLPGVIAVGATDRNDKRWTESDAGSNGGADLDLMAPGTEILSYYQGSSTRLGVFWGTSLACPFVSGVAALMLSANQSLTAKQITDTLTSTADDLGPQGWDEDYGRGIVDARAAVAKAAGESTATTSSSTTSSSTTTSTTSPVSSTSTTTTTSTTSTTAISTTTTTVPTGPFADVSKDTTPYWEQIDYLARLGIVSGSGGGLFHPNDSLKREQFAKIILLALRLPVTENMICPFVDVVHLPGSLYPYHYVAAAYQLSIIKGTDATHFSPYGSLTRAQLITMAVRAAHLPEPPASFTPDFPNFSAAHYSAARKAAYAGWLSGLVGMGPNYDFMAPASRGEVCALLYALLQ